MSLIKIENLTFSYYGYAKPVFENVSFSFDTNWKTGLIGRNGIGKSTLFKLLLDQEDYQGRINKSVDLIKFPPDRIDTSKAGIELYKDLISDAEEWRLFRELNLLSVDENLLYREFGTLSKGEQTKILLAVLFTREDGFLLIDEPTNHLDMDGRRIVSEYLNSKKGFLLISHDRDFLDGCINHVISINRNSIDVQSGNFTSWYDNKMMKDRFEISQNEKLRKDIKRLKEAARQSRIWSDKIEKTKNGVKVSGIKPDKGHIGHQSAKMMQKSKNLENRQIRAIEEKQSLLKDIDTKESLLLHTLHHHKNPLITVSGLSS
ncbi:MAG: ABC-F family ATP-binding cassette domain-containing protein, partial [Eubacterium sp.]|nr:ABC-F family ATP-binding cassette domain-containing protein [Eubacterium sp.]